jgi:hypothetical protein
MDLSASWRESRDASYPERIKSIDCKIEKLQEEIAVFVKRIGYNNGHIESLGREKTSLEKLQLQEDHDKEIVKSIRSVVGVDEEEKVMEISTYLFEAYMILRPMIVRLQENNIEVNAANLHQELSIMLAAVPNAVNEVGLPGIFQFFKQRLIKVFIYD